MCSLCVSCSQAKRKACVANLLAERGLLLCLDGPERSSGMQLRLSCFFAFMQ